MNKEGFLLHRCRRKRFLYFYGQRCKGFGKKSDKVWSDDYGHAFEHFVMQEMIAYKGYNDKRDELSYWHTYDKKEVDAVIGDAKVAIEIKSSEQVKTKHKAGLKAFKDEHPDCPPRPAEILRISGNLTKKIFEDRDKSTTFAPVMCETHCVMATVELRTSIIYGFACHQRKRSRKAILCAFIDETK